MKKIFELLLRFRVVVFIIVGVLTVLFGIMIFQLQVDSNASSFVPEDISSRIITNTINDTYSLSRVMLIGLEHKIGEFTTPEEIQQLRDLTAQLEAVDGVENVISPTNIVVARIEDGFFVATPVFENVFSQEEIDQALIYLREWDVTERLVLSRNNRAVQIILGLEYSLDTTGLNRVLDEVSTTVHAMYSKNTNIYITGEATLSNKIATVTVSDFTRLIPLVAIVIFIVLYISFRRISGVLLTFLVVLVSIVWTFGLKGLFNIPISLVAGTIPVILFSVGSAYAIHFLHSFYHEQSLGKSSQEAVKQALRFVALPVTLAALTSAIGFLSNVFTRVEPMRNYGVFTSIGIFGSVLISLVIMPLILYNTKPPKKRPHRGIVVERYKEIVYRLYTYIIRGRLFVLVGFLLIIITSFIALRNIRVDNNLIGYFSKSSDIAQAADFVKRNFLGTQQISVNIRSTDGALLTNPDVLVAMDNIKATINEEYGDIALVQSFSDFIKRVNQLVHADPDEVSPEEEFESLPSFFSDEADFFEIQDAPLLDAFGDGAAISAESEFAPLIQTLLDVVYLQEYPDPHLQVYFEELAQRINLGGRAYYEIPSDIEKYNVASKQDLENIISQYLVLYAGSLRGWIDSDFEPTSARLTVFLRVEEDSVVSNIADHVKEIAMSYLPAGYTADVGGDTLVQLTFTQLVVQNQLVSLIVSLAAVFLIIYISFRSFAVSFIGIAPVSIALLVNFAVMTVLNISIDVSSALVSSSAIGIGIDYSIHYLSAFRHENKISKSIEETEFHVFFKTGIAIVYNMVTVGAGFLVLGASQFIPIKNLGILVSISMFVTGLSSILLLPVLIDLFRPLVLTGRAKEES